MASARSEDGLVSGVDAHAPAEMVGGEFSGADVVDHAA